MARPRTLTSLLALPNPAKRGKWGLALPNPAKRGKWGLAALLIGLLATFAGPAPAARAQTHLVSATPAPDSTIGKSPDEVRLVFDHPLLPDGTSISVLGSTGVPVDNGSGRIDPADPFALVAALPVLFEGQYTVTYTAATVGSSTILSDTYSFVLDLPDPILTLTVPANGESFRPGPVPVRLEARYIDFDVYETRVRLYVDGRPYREWAGLRASVEGLQPGVHELRTVLVQVGQEMPDTSTTVYIAVERPDPRAVRRAPGTVEPQPLRLSAPQIVGLLALIAAMLGLGFWLGKVTEG